MLQCIVLVNRTIKLLHCRDHLWCVLTAVFCVLCAVQALAGVGPLREALLCAAEVGPFAGLCLGRLFMLVLAASRGPMTGPVLLAGQCSIWSPELHLLIWRPMLPVANVCRSWPAAYLNWIPSQPPQQRCKQYGACWVLQCPVECSSWWATCSQWRLCWWPGRDGS